MLDAGDGCGGPGAQWHAGRAPITGGDRDVIYRRQFVRVNWRGARVVTSLSWQRSSRRRGSGVDEPVHVLKAAGGPADVGRPRGGDERRDGAMKASP